jgi:hypothetical protein
VPTIHEENGFAVRIRTLDHPPAHVHVHKAGGYVKIELDAESGEPRVGRVVGMGDRDVVRAYRIVKNNQQKLLNAWRKIHG